MSLSGSNLNTIPSSTQSIEENLNILSQSLSGQPPIQADQAASAETPVTPTVEPMAKPTNKINSKMEIIDEQEGNNSEVVLKNVRGMKNIIDALLNKKIITAEDAKQIKLAVATKNIDPMSYLVSRNIASEVDIVKVQAEMYGIPFMDLAQSNIETDVLNLLPMEDAKKNMAIVFALTEDGRAKVAMFEPLDIQKVRYIETVIGKKAEVYFATKGQIDEVIDSKYGAQIGTEVTEALEDVGEDIIELNAISKVEDLSVDLNSAPVSKIVNMILEYAVKYKASDVHIEPREKKVSVRFRIYGVMSEKLTIPRKLSSAIVSRIKILSNLKIDEKRVPQDGRFQVKSESKLIDIRVSVLPTVYGEKVVMRLLEKGGGTLNLEDTGLRGSAFKLFVENLFKTQGIILVTGPTGSGKTQTLASSLKKINKPEVNIMTIEDPVEIRVDGVTQVQVNNDVGLTFAKALRSFLRQDPDIIMVGEIRDGETANLAIQAALTGHLVLATLHTNSAAGSLPRLLDMGIEPFLISSTVNIVIAQRLVRKVCDGCKVQYQAPPEIVSQVHKVLDGLKGFNLFAYPKNDPKSNTTIDDDVVMLYKGEGCPKCNNTGYSGRIGIFEGMLMSPKVGQMVMKQRSAAEIQAQAVEEGMITMVQDGFMKALEGLTTMEEVLRVIN